MSSHGAFKEGPDLFIKGQEGREGFKSLKNTRPDWSASSQVFFSQGSNSSDVSRAPCWCLSVLFFYGGNLSIFAYSEPPPIPQQQGYYKSEYMGELSGVITTFPKCPPSKANTTLLDVHIVDYPTESSWHYCRAPAVLLHPSSQIWLASNGSDCNIFYFLVGTEYHFQWFH